jgi:hypothetical protein
MIDRIVSPIILKLHFPEDSSLFAALSERNSDERELIIRNTLNRTSLCRPDDLIFHCEWLLVRQYVCSVEGQDASNKSYLPNVPAVQEKIKEIIKRPGPIPYRAISELQVISKNSLRRFLESEYSHDWMESSGVRANEEDVRKYGENMMKSYISEARKVIVLNQ